MVNELIAIRGNFMKFKTILACTLAGMVGISGAAHAVNVNPDGLGQVLFYPYYTVKGGNDTLISLTNSTDEAKGVKVRFMESQNSREVLDFNLYLSAHDVWTAAITDIDGTPTLIINDTSCTTPYLYPIGKQPFLTFALDEDNDDISRTAEGHIEVIEMGTLVGDSAVAATHVTTRIDEDTEEEYDLDVPEPADCEKLNDAWTYYTFQDDGYWIQDSHTDMEDPSGGLFGGAAIVNPTDGTLYSYEAYAINGFATEVGELHQVPGTVFPSLNSGDVKTGNVFLDDAVFTSEEFDRGVDAVSFVFMHYQLMNEYSLNSFLDASTEWVITFPTKSFYVDEEAAELPVIVEGEGDDAVEIPQAIPPFTTVWDGEEACEPMTISSVYDREEQTIDEPVGGERPPIVSPPLPDAPDVDPAFELCFETNVIEFGPEGSGSSSIFGSENVLHVDPTELGFEEGWMRLNFYELPEGGFREGLGGLAGLPAVGFSASRFVNNFASPGVRANYNLIFNHKATRAPDCEHFELEVCD
jgi:hypothetical protein